MACFRPYIVSSLLDSLSLNIRRNYFGSKMMEYGKVYRGNEISSFCAVVGGRKSRGEIYSIFDLKSDLESLFKFLSFDYEFELSDIPFLRKSAKIIINDKVVGFIGEIKRSVLKAYEIKFPVYCAEFELDYEMDLKFGKVYKFPPVFRDISIVVKKEVSYKTIERIFKQSNIKNLVEFKLIDIYEGEQVKEGYKSLTFSLKFQDEERTLSDEEVNESFNKLVDNLLKNDIKVRGINYE
jgi:phenylalanyl-tRNA synthetase beta chain